MNTLKKVALGATATLMAAGGSLAAIPVAHAATAPVGSISASRTASGTCTIKWTDSRTSNVYWVITETNLETGNVRSGFVYDAHVRQTKFTFRNGNHRFRYTMRASQNGEQSTAKSAVCGKA